MHEPRSHVEHPHVLPKGDTREEERTKEYAMAVRAIVDEITDIIETLTPEEVQEQIDAMTDEIFKKAVQSMMQDTHHQRTVLAALALHRMDPEKRKRFIDHVHTINSVVYFPAIHDAKAAIRCYNIMHHPEIFN